LEHDNCSATPKSKRSKRKCKTEEASSERQTLIPYAPYTRARSRPADHLAATQRISTAAEEAEGKKTQYERIIAFYAEVREKEIAY
jgi:hypothetical protein